jgi:hypothetical protein
MSESEIVAYNLGIAAEMRRIVGALDEARIPCIVLKGIPLRERIGVPLAQRAITDNDILVRRADVRRAKVALEKLGYESLSWRGLKHDLQHGFEHPLSRPDVDGRPLFCELHWNAFPPSLFHATEDTLWERSVEVAVFGARVRVFEPTLQILHLASHAAQHELCEPATIEIFGRAWTRWHDEIDPTDLRRLAKEIGVEYVLEYVVEAVRALGLTQGERLAARSRRAAIAARLLAPARLLEPAEDKYPERYFRALLVLMLVDRSQALRQLMERAFPAPEYLVQKNGWRAVALHYVARPWRPVARSARSLPYGRQAAAVSTYVAVYRSLHSRYCGNALDRLLEDLEAAPRAASPLPVAELTRAVRVAERIAPRLSSTPNTCLFRALSRYALLSRHAHRATFVLAVAPRSELPGHAWVEVAGKPFLEESVNVAEFTRILARENPSDRA